MIPFRDQDGGLSASIASAPSFINDTASRWTGSRKSKWRLTHGASAIYYRLMARAKTQRANLSLSDAFSFGACLEASIAARKTDTTDDGVPLQAQQCNNRASGVAGSTKHWLLPSRRTHTHPAAATAATTAAAASGVCYFANCKPVQDNKMASRHFVNISVLAQSAAGRLLADRCAD